MLEDACKSKDDYLTCITKDSAGCCTEQLSVDFQIWTDDLGTMMEACKTWKTCRRCTAGSSSLRVPLFLVATMSMLAYVIA